MAEPSFEDLYKQLEEKAARLDDGKLPLEESIKLYEEGVGLVDRLREMLTSAELRVRTLERRLADDEFELREMDDGSEGTYDSGQDGD
ncbi:MAG: exodeoxyribonuclease VII small subunit [Dehalococcoidia bacterium]|nr:exodeoxyribonuclease VII small subunit [Dehalococcoidia bacterium]MCA9826197.1 exodeoxyribonuclease VII small subunit [Dehalococcoidia bacterium]MCA9844191.1 exodeoxyribonuclease VII small subunit [Dehalococcoidia bacterium]